MKKSIRTRALAFNVFYWFTATTKVTSMSGGNMCGCWVSELHQQAPTTIILN